MILPNIKFGFRNNHSYLHQVYGIGDKITSSIDRKHFYTGFFLDVGQAFVQVWHEELLYKIRFLPTSQYLFFMSSLFITHSLCVAKIYQLTIL